MRLLQTSLLLSLCGHLSEGFSISSRQSLASTRLRLQKGWFVPDNEADDEDVVTREMLQRDLLKDPKVKRKKGKGKGYEPMDNRDHLPFAVKKITPDPYTPPHVKRQRQAKAPKRKAPDLELVGSRLKLKQDDTSTVLGEFQLDKSTTSGDIIELGNRQYKVETARCQYKYAGGKRFVMMRKILEVKEITRVQVERQLQRSLEAASKFIDKADGDIKEE
mmetsp:Transcript_21332/g.61489  ORF Transcript_21332/g.61489 Transcript_21332/m.61489 type:complete len:219 (-) Transcript_21332:66-722(-)